MDVAAQFSARVAAELNGTPFTMTPTPRGFVVSLRLDEQWSGLLHAQSIREDIRYTVRVNDSSFSINDSVRRLRWNASAGLLKAGLGFSYQSGRVVRTYSIATLTNGIRTAYQPETIRKRIKAIGIELGLKPRMSPVLLGALLVGPIAVAIVGIVLGITLGLVPLLSR